MKKYIIIIASLALIEIGLALYLTFWRELFWNYVEAKDFHGFLVQIGVFTVVALIFCFVTAYAGYFSTLCGIKYREILDSRCQNVLNSRIENVNQRIQEDCKEYPKLLLNVYFGLGKAIVYVLVFSISLALNFSFVYLIAIVSYAIVSTIVARKIAMPLFGLNYKMQVVEATYRNNLSDLNLKNCLTVMFDMAIKTKRLAYFQTFYGQLAVVLPIMIVAPAYFHGAMTLGGLMQATGTMGTVSDNMSFGIYMFNDINKLMSCKIRLKEMGVI